MSRYDVVLVAGLLLILWQALSHQIDGQPSDQPLLYIGMALVGAGLGMKLTTH